ncbi:MAG: phosphatase PAP2 family protein [Arcicella sp.]|nr:phosphatase PAP2 family protein [Arcicella sp.]
MSVLNDFLKNKTRMLFGIITTLIVGFISLSYFVLITPPSYIDMHISEEIQERQNGTLEAIMKLVSWFGNLPQSLVIVIFAAILFFLFKLKREAIFTLLTLLSGVFSSSLKLLIGRPRPTENLVRIIEKAKQQSYPSGHTLFYTVFFGFLIIAMGNLKHVNKVLKFAVISFSAGMIFLIPISRVYLGAHWFTDVLGGFILGIVYLFILGYIYLGLKTPTQ